MANCTGKVLAGSLLAAAFAISADAQERVVHVYNWSEYVDPSVLEDFTRDTGIKVVYDTFDSNEILETKLLTGGSGYDVVVSTTSFLARQIKAGVFQKLDKSKLPNLVNMWDAISKRTAEFDPDNAYSVNYAWGTIGVGYNIDKVKAALGTDKIESWETVFNSDSMSKLATCGVYMLDAPVSVISPTLKYLGKDPNDYSRENLQRVEDLLMKIRPHIRKFAAGEFTNALASGDACFGISAAGWVLQARSAAIEGGTGIKIGYAVMKEGTEVWFDQMAIPADAPDVAEAHEFIDYIMRPEVAAKITNKIRYANGNKASQKFILPEVLNDPAIYPGEEVMSKMFAVKPQDQQTQRLMNRMWTKVVTGQ